MSLLMASNDALLDSLAHFRQDSSCQTAADAVRLQPESVGSVHKDFGPPAS